MKNATKHAAKLRALVKSAVAADHPDRPEPSDGVRALVLGALAADAPHDFAEETLRRLEAHFVDLNELRVATELEMSDLLTTPDGTRYPRIAQRADHMQPPLHGIFDKEQALKLDRVGQLERPALRKFFHELPGMTPFVEAFTLLVGFGLPAFPTDDWALAVLEADEAIEPGTTHAECAAFVEATVSKADDLWALHCYVRAAAVEQGLLDEPAEEADGDEDDDRPKRAAKKAAKSKR